MSSKKVNSFGGLVYSTDPNFKLQDNTTEEEQTLAPVQQKLRIRLDKKQRAGKAVTLIEGFIGKAADKEQLGKSLKAFCGTGGSVKGDEILVQGDNRDRVMQWLQKNGYTAAKKF
jgi:translation initiation factor 1